MISYNTWEAIAETPWYIYLLIWALLYLGYASTKPRVIMVKPQIISQILSLVIFIAMLFSLITISPQQIPLILGSCFIGFLLGYLHFYAGRVSAIQGTGKVFVPGSWTILVVIASLIFAKYYFYGHRFFISIEIIRDPRYLPVFLFFSGLAMGLILGRVLYLARVLKSGPFFVGELPEEFAKHGIIKSPPSPPHARARK